MSTDFQDSIFRADVLIEALPYLQNFRGSTVVIKYGGSAMEDPTLVEGVLKDIVFLEAAGINPVVVHGGGKAINKALAASGVQPRFAAGLRVTDADTIRVVDHVLNSEVNPAIVEGINSLGGRAVPFNGRDVFRARKAPPATVDGNEVDLGFVGEVDGCQIVRVLEAVRAETVPVISPLGQDTDRLPYNINADVAAAEIALSIEAAKIIYLSDVNGILMDPTDTASRLPTVDPSAIEKLITDGVITGGMLPKVHSCLRALQHGVQKIHLIDGRIPHALLLELFTDRGIGTEIIPTG